MKTSLHAEKFRGLDLKDNELLIRDIKIQEHTMGLNGKHIRVPENTVIPGPFVAFCQAIGSSKKTKYVNFSIIRSFTMFQKPTTCLGKGKMTINPIIIL